MQNQSQNNTWGGVLQNQDIPGQVETVVRKVIGLINTQKLCKIIAISNGEKKYYTVQALVSNISPGGSEVQADKFFDIQDMFTTGGNGGFIIERAIGDIVLVGFFDRESTGALRNGAASALKSFDICPRTSGVILGGVYYTTPTVHITINNNITMVGDTSLTGDLNQTGSQTISGDVSAGGTVSAPTAEFDTVTVPAAQLMTGGANGIQVLDTTGTPHPVANGILL